MILKLFFTWRLSLFAITFLGSQLFPLIANTGIGAISKDHPFNYWASWAQWDGGHFVNIAQKGFFSIYEYAFFPLYPFLIKVLSFPLFGNFILSGLIISNICVILFLFIFYNLIKEKFEEKIAKISVLSFLLFPTTFFLGAAYSESLFILLAVLMLYFLDKKRFFTAALFCAFASATRFVGILLVIPFIWEYWKSTKYNFKNIKFNVFSIVLAISGFSLYSFYLLLKFGDPLYFFTVESNWKRQLANPFFTFASYFVDFTKRTFTDYLDISITIIFISLLILGYKKIPKSWTIYSFLILLVPASTGTLTSMPRYMLAAFPVFITFSYLVKNRRVLRIILYLAMIFFQAVLAVRFINGYWVA